MAVPRVMGILDNNPIPFMSTSHKQRKQARNRKEDAIHDAERKGSLQHRASLHCADMESIHRDGA